MNSTVLKILKTIASVSVAFISFTIIVIIAFYFYLSDGVEFNLNKSNQTLSSLTNRFELDFSKSSSIYFKALKYIDELLLKSSSNLFVKLLKV